MLLASHYRPSTLEQLTFYTVLIGVPWLAITVGRRLFTNKQTCAEMRRHGWMVIVVVIHVAVLATIVRRELQSLVLIWHPILAAFYITGIQLLRHVQRADRWLGAGIALVAFVLIAWHGLVLVDGMYPRDQAFWQGCFGLFLVELALFSAVYVRSSRHTPLVDDV